MKTTKDVQPQVTGKLRNAYWRVVVDCLVEFHGLGKQEARARVKELRSYLDNPLPGLVKDLYLNTEPFYRACDLAKNELDPSQLRKPYDAILERHEW